MASKRRNSSACTNGCTTNRSGCEIPITHIASGAHSDSRPVRAHHRPMHRHPATASPRWPAWSSVPPHRRRRPARRIRQLSEQSAAAVDCRVRPEPPRPPLLLESIPAQSFPRGQPYGRSHSSAHRDPASIAAPARTRGAARCAVARRAAPALSGAQKTSHRPPLLAHERRRTSPGPLRIRAHALPKLLLRSDRCFTSCTASRFRHCSRCHGRSAEPRSRPMPQWNRRTFRQPAQPPPAGQ